MPRAATAVPPGTRCQHCSRVMATRTRRIIRHAARRAYDGAVDDFWPRRRVLVTGGRGFLGRAVCDEIAARGARDLVRPRRSDYDLTRPDDVEKLFADAAPDVVIHLAARVGGIGANLAAPAELYLANLLMGTHVIEEARRRGADKTVILGTICSYPKRTPVPFVEDALWEGYPEETNAPYGLAKKALLVHAQANRSQYGQNVIYLLPTNLFGPGDKFHPRVSHVIPALIKRCIDAKERGDGIVDVWGTGRATREFLFVGDAAEAIALATERYDGAEPVNIGSGREIAIRDLASLIASLVGFTGVLRWDPSKPDGQPRRRVDSSRAREAFGFEASTGLEDGLRATIDWYLAHRREAEVAPRA
jgi:GDP-L-fucose synthase